MPLSEPYAIGLILLGMARCAPFLPMVVDRARGDPAYAAAVILLMSVVKHPQVSRLSAASPINPHFCPL